MILTAIVIAVLLPDEGWKSKYFEDVQLTAGGPKLTVQVAWLRPRILSSNSSLPCIVSVFEGPRGKRKLLRSTKVQSMSDRRQSYLYYHKESDTTFLDISLLVDGKSIGGIYIFEDLRPVPVLIQGSMRTYMLAEGRLEEWSRAQDEGVEMSEDHYPYPRVERALLWNKKQKAFIPGPWKPMVSNPPAVADITGERNGHTFRVRIEKQNFHLGDRQLSSKDDGSTNLADGEVAYGSDWWEPKHFIAMEFSSRFYQTEIIKFEVWIDGVEIEVPEKLWNTCFNPNLSTNPEQPYVFAWLSEDGSRVVVKMLGSDAAGSYRAVWTIRKDGGHEREVDRDC